MPASKIVDRREVERWIADGRTFAWMRDEYLRKYGLRVSVSMFSMFRKRHGLDGRIVQDRELVPWAVKRAHRWQYPVQMLRVLARRRAGEPLRADDARRLRAFLARLRHDRTVVDYDPAVGFRYVPRTADDDDVIRRPARQTARPASV